MKALGVDIGATNIRIALGDKEGNILKKITEKININNGSIGIANQIIRIIIKITS